jgi:hypothetical protein
MDFLNGYSLLQIQHQAVSHSVHKHFTQFREGKCIWSPFHFFKGRLYTAAGAFIVQVNHDS